jgi:hypothetical protein
MLLMLVELKAAFLFLYGKRCLAEKSALVMRRSRAALTGKTYTAPT